ncbi:MAG TPA: hypothetical protein VD968_04540 [Pyrinomonadaceae bacterium]|nr:hypothetical protein [Pyrinomonadaceae bacterium]
MLAVRPLEPQVETAENLLQNAGFEKDDDRNNLPDAWTVLRGSFALDPGVKYRDKRGLRVSTTDPEAAPVIYQTVPCKPGGEYYFRAWVRGQGLAGSSPIGAGVFMGWTGKDGKYLGGEYPPGLMGTFNWALVEGKVVIPEEATVIHFGCYLHRGTTGTAWFDAACVEPVRPGPLTVYVLWPHYRGVVVPPIVKPFRAEISLRRMGQWGKRQATVRSELRDSRGNVVAKAEAVFAPAESVKTLELQVPKSLPLGKYRWWFGLFNVTGQTLLDEGEYGVTASASMPAVHFDEAGNTIVNGSRFFPLGVFMGPTEDEHLARIAAAGFNTVLSYGHGLGEGTAPEQSTRAFFDRAQRHGLRVFYHTLNFYEGTKGFINTGHPSGLDAARYFATQVSDHPALLAYYTADEPHPSLVPKLRDMYNRLVETDFNHPCYQVHHLGNQTDGRVIATHLQLFYDSHDVVGVDPYVVPCSPLDLVAVWTEGALGSTRRAKPVWVVPQLHDLSAYETTDKAPDYCLEPKLREPTFAERRCMAYLALTAGAKGLIFYNYYDLFRTTGEVLLPATDPLVQRRLGEFHQLGQELRFIIPPLLRWERIPLTFAPATTPVRRISMRMGKTLYFLLANPTKQQQTVRVALPPGDWREAKARHGGLTVALAGARLDVTLPAVGSGDVVVNAA